jgi:hypothetical protein
MTNDQFGKSDEQNLFQNQLVMTRLATKASRPPPPENYEILGTIFKSETCQKHLFRLRKVSSFATVYLYKISRFVKNKDKYCTLK